MNHATILPIIMAGGMGTRLHPLTETMPKPLIPVDGVPAICRILDFLAEQGFSRAVVTVRYRANEIRSLLGEQYRGIRVSYADESDDPTPLGTAGSVRFAWDTFAAPEDTDALILSGDAVFRTDFDAFLRTHTKQPTADATVLCVRVSDPTAFGVVLTDDGTRITGFSEKPSAAEAISDTVNTGIYLLSASFVARIPRDAPSDFGQDVFPAALTDGRALRMYLSDGYWCDIGSFDAYLDCCLDMASGRIPGFAPSRVLLPPHISESCIGRDCFLPGTCSVRQSVLFDGVVLGAGASVSGSILANGVRVGKMAVIEGGCIVGANAVIGDFAHLTRMTRVPAGATVTAENDGFPENAPPPRTPAHQNRPHRFSDDDRIAAYCCDAGYALSQSGSFVPDVRVCSAVAETLLAFATATDRILLIAHDGDIPALVTAQTVIRETVACLGNASTPVFCVRDALSPSVLRMPHLGEVLYDRGEKRPVFRVLLTRNNDRLCAALFDDLGLYPPRAEERKLDALFAESMQNTVRTAPAKQTLLAPPVRLPASVLYDAYLARYRFPLASTVPFRTGTDAEERFLARFLCACGARESPFASMLLRIEAGDGGNRLLSVLDLTGRARMARVTHWEVFSMLCDAKRAEMRIPFPTPRAGTSPEQRLSVPVTAPEMAGDILRYSHCPTLSDHGTDTPAHIARRAAATEAEDAVLLASKLLSLVSAEDLPLSALRAANAEERRNTAYRATDSVPASAATATLRRMTESRNRTSGAAFVPATEGILCKREDGTAVRVVATRENRFRIIADAYSAEVAEELCTFARERILRESVSEPM